MGTSAARWIIITQNWQGLDPKRSSPPDAASWLNQHGAGGISVSLITVNNIDTDELPQFRLDFLSHFSG